MASLRRGLFPAPHSAPAASALSPDPSPPGAGWLPATLGASLFPVHVDEGTEGRFTLAFPGGVVLRPTLAGESRSFTPEPVMGQEKGVCHSGSSRSPY